LDNFSYREWFTYYQYLVKFRLFDMKSICVFCGSKVGARSEYAATAVGAGRLLARRGITLIYGGGHVGIMGTIADAVLEAGGRVVGVIPSPMVEREWAHRGVSELIITKNMHERKQKMADLADAFIALPGGVGTLEELFEVFTWLQLDYHAKPVGLLNTGDYYGHLLRFLEHMCEEKFLKPSQLETLVVSNSMEDILTRFEERMH
jgi:uncharacterized protein (TIGR00730 family)